MSGDIFGDAIQTLLVVMGVCIAVALTGLIALVRRMRRLRVPPDADFFTTLRYVPLTLVLLLDMLDFGLDILSAPIVWIILDRMGLYGLRNKAAAEALIPFTQPIPTFTLSWLAARLLNLGEPPGRYVYPRRMRSTHSRRRPRIIDMDE